MSLSRALAVCLVPVFVCEGWVAPWNPWKNEFDGLRMSEEMQELRPGAIDGRCRLE